VKAPDQASGQSFTLAWQHRILGAPGILVALFWGFAEATLFFILPDVWLSFVALFDLRKTWRHILAALAGAVVGGAVLFHWSAVEPGPARAVVAHVPFITEQMFARADDGLRQHGLFAVFLGSVTGIPYKIYAVEAPHFFTEKEFLMATPSARVVRFVLVWLGIGLAAKWLRKSRGWNERQVIRMHAGVWIASYALYWGRIVFR
jgi:membrane protein YqaA with SNARE-associated domain